MMSRNIKNIINGLLFFLTFVFLPCQAMAIHVSPEEVKVSATYNGQDIFVTGEAKDNEEVVVQIIGQSSEVDLKQKGKVGGFLWMTVGHITIDNAPNAYLVCLPKTVNSWRMADDPRWKDLNLGFSSLMPGVKIEPEGQDVATVFNDFVKLKTSDALYQLVGDVIEYQTSSGGNREFKAQIHIPAKMPVASYEVRVLRIKNDGRIAGAESVQLHLVETGFPKFISNLAFNKSLLYGVLSAGIAILAGLFMGVLFKDRGGAH